MKKDIKSALGKSLKEETTAVEKRFAQADIVFSQHKTETEDEPLEIEKIEKVIRDSFTLPLQDYQLIEVIKKRALKASVSVTKSEIIRAGLLALQSMSEQELISVINSLTKIKSGRRAVKVKI